MSKAHRSGITVRSADIPVILTMVARGDRRHDVAAWFGLNQGRIKEVEDGDHGMSPLTSQRDLPPSGSPGPKARRLRDSVEEVRKLLQRQNAGDTKAAADRLDRAIADFDKNE